jgi:hypothetical protein
MTTHGAVLTLIWCAFAAAGVINLAWAEYKIDRENHQ